jgi:ribosomal protein S18 acetylase RimI-like enzyme
MRVGHAYEGYLRHFSQQHPEAAALEFDRLRDLYYGDAFGTSDAWTAALEPLGYETFAVVANYELLQKAWAREHGVDVAEGPWSRDILLAQARTFRPEVMWLNTHDHDLARRLRHQVPGLRLIFQAVGGALDLSYPFGDLDFVISCAPELVAALHKRGVPAHHIHHAFDERILRRLPPGGPPVHDLVFAGQLVAGERFHEGRQALLSRLAVECPIEIFTLAFDPGARGRLCPEWLWRSLARSVQLAVARGLPESVVRRIPKVRSLLDLRLNPAIESQLRPAVYGLGMYGTFRRARISVNVHADASPSHASNQRLYEVTGVGSCLLTDWRDNLPDLFEPDREVVAYRTAGECVEKVRWLLAHEPERETIARAGQQRCLAQHTHRHRAPLVDAVIREALARVHRLPRGAGGVAS